MVDVMGDLLKRNMDTATGLGGALFESMEHLVRLNTNVMQRQMERVGQVSDLSQMRPGATPMSLFPDEILHYPQALYEIVAQTQTRMTQILGEHFREATREAQLGLRQTLAGGPSATAAPREAPQQERARAEPRRR